MVQTLPTRCFTADEYDRMIEAGILCEDERVELIDGRIVGMAALGNRHLACVDRCTRQLGTLNTSGRAILRVQGSIRLSPGSEPEPDIVLLRPRADFYEGTAAGPADILLVIEVADTSLHYDRDVKIPLYAAAGIPETWLAVVGSRRRFEVFRGPEGGTYRDHQVLNRDASIAPLAFPDLVIPVRTILG